MEGRLEMRISRLRHIVSSLMQKTENHKVQVNNTQIYGEESVKSLQNHTRVQRLISNGNRKERCDPNLFLAPRVPDECVTQSRSLLQLFKSWKCRARCCYSAANKEKHRFLFKNGKWDWSETAELMKGLWGRNSICDLWPPEEGNKQSWGTTRASVLLSSVWVL